MKKTLLEILFCFVISGLSLNFDRTKPHFSTVPGIRLSDTERNLKWNMDQYCFPDVSWLSTMANSSGIPLVKNFLGLAGTAGTRACGPVFFPVFFPSQVNSSKRIHACWSEGMLDFKTNRSFNCDALIGGTSRIPVDVAGTRSCLSSIYRVQSALFQ